MTGEEFSQGEGQRAGSLSRSGQGDARKRGFTEGTSKAQDLEARRDAFKRQSKLLVPLHEAQSRLYLTNPFSNRVTLPEKNKNDVFAEYSFYKPSTIEIVSDDVNWYSIDRERPGHAPGYVAKVIAANPDAVAALAATMIELAKENNSNLVLAWFEFPGKAAGASPSTFELSNIGGVSTHANKPSLSTDSEASRSKKPRLSLDPNVSLPPHVEGLSHPDPICANCQLPGHALARCRKPSRVGYIEGCPHHNVTTHSLDTCPLYAGRGLPTLSDVELAGLCHLQAFGRSKRPAIRSEGFFWLDCLLEASKRNLIAKEMDWHARSALPWTPEYACKIYATGFHLKGDPAQSGLYSGRTPTGPRTWMERDPFWGRQTVGHVVAAHDRGEFEHLRWGEAVTAGILGQRTPPQVGRPAAPAPKGPGLTEKDEQNIMRDLDKALGPKDLFDVL